MRSKLPLLALLGATALAGVARADIVFLSNQLRPIEEAEKVRQVILKDFPEPVDYVVDEPGPWVARIRAEAESGSVNTGLLGGLHGDFATIEDALDPVGDVMAQLGDRGIDPEYAELAKLGGDQPMYVPWMQATYIMVASKQALEHLPEGASLESLTYEQLAEWGARIEEATGERKLGFPAGPKGLMYRLFQGSLYPAYTGGVVRTFKSDEAEAMWAGFKEIWDSTNPRSTSYDFMQEPLLAGDVWVAFDHVARVINALREKPDEFVAFPAPSGPKGLGYMPVLAGMAIPKGAEDRATAVELIKHLTRPEVQVMTLRETAFFPVVEVEMPEDLPEGLQLASAAIEQQVEAENAIVSLLPVGLGEKNGEFNKVFTDAFQRIVVRGRDIADSLEAEGEKLAEIMQEAGASCWRPDAPSDGPCPVE
jgi:multiple sugar transport system substrate-binding protein